MGRRILALTWVAAAACGGGGTPIIDAATDGASQDGNVGDDDAAVDASAIDASTIDAGAIDAGPIDAGPIDAAAIDAAPIDAGAIDAGPIDAAAIDAGAIDAGAIDAGAIDVGAIDAGAIDATLCTVGLGDLVPATVTVTTDDNTHLFVNGTLIDATPYIWSNPHQYTVMLYRHPSRINVIAIEGVNLQNTTGYDRGILFDLRVTVDAAVQTVVTDTSWRVTNTLSAGWEQPSFDDLGWAAPFDLGPHGIGPWGAVLSGLAPGTAAHWIWTYDPAANPNKPQNESTFARKSFAIVDPLCGSIATD